MIIINLTMYELSANSLTFISLTADRAREKMETIDSINAIQKHFKHQWMLISDYCTYHLDFNYNNVQKKI